MSSVEGIVVNDEYRERISDFEKSEDERRSRICYLKKKALNASTKFKHSLKKKRKEYGTDTILEGQERKWIEMARLKSGWTLLMANLILEMASAVFDQLGYALVGMVLAFVALILATAELIYMARKERMSLLPLFHRPSTTTLAPGKPVGTIVEYFGLVGAVWQCFYSTVEYAYARQKKDNPIKMCLLPFKILNGANRLPGRRWATITGQ